MGIGFILRGLRSRWSDGNRGGGSNGEGGGGRRQQRPCLMMDLATRLSEAMEDVKEKQSAIAVIRVDLEAARKKIKKMMAEEDDLEQHLVEELASLSYCEANRDAIAYRLQTKAKDMTAKGRKEGIHAAAARCIGFLGPITADEAASYPLADGGHVFTLGSRWSDGNRGGGINGEGGGGQRQQRPCLMMGLATKLSEAMEDVKEKQSVIAVTRVDLEAARNETKKMMAEEDDLQQHLAEELAALRYCEANRDALAHRLQTNAKKMTAKGRKEGIYAAAARSIGFLGLISADEEASNPLADGGHAFTLVAPPPED